MNQVQDNTGKYITNPIFGGDTYIFITKIISKTKKLKAKSNLRETNDKKCDY